VEIQGLEQSAAVGVGCPIEAFDRAFGTITGTRNLYGATREWHVVTRIRFGKLRPTSYWCFSCPDKSMAPVLAITDMVARARGDDSLRQESPAHISNDMGVPPALPGTHAKFDRNGSPSKKLLA
jgi:hypothetical protein